MTGRGDIPRLVIAAVVEAPIRLYRRYLSPVLPRRCKYEPSCSVYALSALRSYGIVRGLLLAGWRVLRCNPFSHGGYDPVEAQSIFARGRHGAEGHSSRFGARLATREAQTGQVEPDRADRHVEVRT